MEKLAIGDVRALDPERYRFLNRDEPRTVLLGTFDLTVNSIIFFCIS